jgi:hypothetical protein
MTKLLLDLSTSNPKTDNTSRDGHHPEHPSIMVNLDSLDPRIRLYPSIVTPCEAVARTPPSTIMRVVVTIATFRPK